MCAYLRWCFGSCSGISFMDSTSLRVCHNRRIERNKVFENVAARGRTSVDWFFGNNSCIWWSTTEASCDSIVLTPGNTDDRTPVPKLLQQHETAINAAQ